ncbi:MAG: hypothetical protein R3E95_06265 [Thiolinea sp.]
MDSGRGAANIGWEGQCTLLEQVKAWLPAGVAVRLLADRFYPSASLFNWLQGKVGSTGYA